ncbi:MAG: DUF1992 domain-containing protein [Desulfovibrionaceae bacterium]
MSIFQRIAEERIQNSIRNGAFDDLDGAGKPLALDDDSMVPEDLRMAYKMLKNAGFVPPEIADAKEIRSIVDMLETCQDEKIRFTQIKKLGLLLAKTAQHRNRAVVLDENSDYYRKAVACLSVAAQTKTAGSR